MNRRRFIKLLGSGLFVAAAPPIIFDLGKNLSKRQELVKLIGELREDQLNMREFRRLYMELLYHPDRLIAHDGYYELRL